MLYKHLPPDKIGISHRIKQRTMSNSMSIEYEAIKPTQSIELIPESETQDEIPETQESVSNFDIFYPDDLTSDDDDPCDMMDCTGCRPMFLEETHGVRRLCATCRYYGESE